MGEVAGDSGYFVCACGPLRLSLKAFEEDLLCLPLMIFRPILAGIQILRRFLGHEDRDGLINN
jgi:hypothetical protein